MGDAVDDGLQAEQVDELGVVRVRYEVHLGRRRLRRRNLPTHTHTQVRRGRTLPKSSFVSPTPFPDRCLLERPSKSLDRR